MLSPYEFTVGSVGSAKPGSLILPRTEYEATVLIGETEEGPAAVFLSGRYSFRFFQSRGNTSWNGLIIPGIRVEVDQSSLFDPPSGNDLSGSIIRTQTQLVVRAKPEHSFGRLASIVLQHALAASEGSAGFTKWRIVIGEGYDKRILHEVDLAKTNSHAS